MSADDDSARAGDRAVTEPRTCEFGDVYIDFGRMTVKRSGAIIAIEPKVFDLLRFLIANRERVVTKEELLDALWRETYVAPNALTRAVAQLRKALGDDADEPRYIETVARRGYRFIAPVVIDPGAASEVVAAAVPIPPPRRPAGMVFIAVAVVAILGIGVA